MCFETMRILTFTTLYPNAAAPHHGVFVENRLRAFVKHGGAEVRVIAPVPWFPFRGDWAGKYAAYAAAPIEETRYGISISHPRYFVPPKVGMTYAAGSLTRCFDHAVDRLLESGWDFDLIDAHYFYPDGVAAARVARRLGKPFVVTARGTDINFLPRYPAQRRMILEAAAAADGIVTVASALKTELASLGADASKIRVLRNGVDLDQFKPLDRDALREKAGLSGPVLASVGHLIERKGHHLVIEALKEIEDATLLIAGDGEERDALKRLAERCGVAGRTHFLGRTPHEKLPEIYATADALVLASSREGWANVLLEAMACGTPVVATDVWGSAEAVRAPEAGILVKTRDAKAIAAAIRTLLAAPPDRAATRRYAEQHSWDATSKGLAELFSGIIGARTKTATPAVSRSSVAPKMIVTVDTEEEFDWDARQTTRHAVCDPADIDRFQRVAARAGAKPLYFLTYPVMKDARAAAYFRALADQGAAELGVHLHAWVTPPIGGAEDDAYSWQCHLPQDVQTAKLRAAADAYEAAFGRSPISHRAGRYGVDERSYAPMAAAGLKLDFSPSPGFDYSASGGPDFSGMSNQPFHVETPHGRVHVTPVCGGRAFKGGNLFTAPPRGPGGFSVGKRSLKDGLLAPMRLTCEDTKLDDLKALTRRLIADTTPVLTFSLHSTTLTPGANPYSREARDIDRALEVTAAYFDWFRAECGGVFISVDELARDLGVAAPEPACA
jgi:glycosyltransferase involved in cell wall biosynthesis